MGALICKAEQLIALCEAQGMSTSKILIQVPGSWAGIQAAGALQAKGVDCEVTDVYSFAQAVAAIKAKAAVLVVNVTHVNLWYDRHPGVIRDPHVRSHTLPDHS
jgi:transaldolase